MKKVKIESVTPTGIAGEMGLVPGDYILTINGQEISHELDYQWLIGDGDIIVEVEKADGEIWELDIEKEGPQGLGLTLEPMHKRCKNACIFCFIDQQPPGLRESLYVKDDDFYQSFMEGNYITFTNLSEADFELIINARFSPMHISVHATCPDLRVKMMGNPKARELMPLLKRLDSAGIDMHFQIVLCKGINDGAYLDDSIVSLYELGEHARSLSVVPVGLTKHREGLYPLAPFTPEDAAKVITQVETWQTRIGCGFVYLADEWYILANQPIPQYETYDDFPQLANGVGMMALFEDEFLRELNDLHVVGADLVSARACENTIHIATGQAAAPFMTKLAKDFTTHFPNTNITIHPIQNNFYGHSVTVSGLITGRDIITQLTPHAHKIDILFIPENAFRVNTNDMLDGTTLQEISAALGTQAIKGSQNGDEFCKQIIQIVTNH